MDVLNGLSITHTEEDKHSGKMFLCGIFHMNTGGLAHLDDLFHHRGCDCDGPLVAHLSLAVVACSQVEAGLVQVLLAGPLEEREGGEKLQHLLHPQAAPAVDLNVGMSFTIKFQRLCGKFAA